MKPGKWTSFPRSVKLKKNETVIFSYIVYKSRAAATTCIAQGDEAIRASPTMMDPKKMPFDGKRMIFGGFKTAILM